MRKVDGRKREPIQYAKEDLSNFLHQFTGSSRYTTSPVRQHNNAREVQITHRRSSTVTWVLTVEAGKCASRTDEIELDFFVVCFVQPPYMRSVQTHPSMDPFIGQIFRCTTSLQAKTFI